MSSQLSSTSAVCLGCRSPQVVSQCGVCKAGLCRKCRIFLSEDEFPFADERSPELKHAYYCGPCNNQHVEPFRSEYEDALERAKATNIIFKGSKSTVRILKRAQQAIQVTDIADRDEAILRLAFQAAKQDFNSVIDVEVSTQKVRNEGWQKQSWSGRGVPAEIAARSEEKE